MEYQIEISVPANTLETAKVHQQLGLCYGVIRDYRIIIPPGSAGAVRCNVWYHSQQVLPMTADTAFIGDDYAGEMPCDVELFEKPFVLDIYAWSPGTIYDHVIYLSFHVEAPQTGITVPLYSNVSEELPEGVE